MPQHLDDGDVALASILLRRPKQTVVGSLVKRLRRGLGLLEISHPYGTIINCALLHCPLKERAKS